jgi:4'-phosphopantetheinyl transferase EntD
MGTHTAGRRENLNCMDSKKLCDTLSDTMPDGVCVAAGPSIEMQLCARESASLGAADVKRLREFASGRAYAKQALSMLGVYDVDLPIGPNRAPVWPPCVVGALRTFCITTMGRMSQRQSLARPQC